MRRLRADVATRQSVLTAVAVMSGQPAVQNFGINAMKRSGTLRGSCRENSIPEFGRSFAIDVKLAKCEQTFPDPVYRVGAGDGYRGVPKALQYKHRTQTKFDRS